MLSIWRFACQNYTFCENARSSLNCSNHCFSAWRLCLRLINSRWSILTVLIDTPRNWLQALCFGFPMFLRWAAWRVALCAFLLLLIQRSLAFELVLGKVSSDSQKAVEELTPMVEFAAEALSEYGVTKGVVRLFDSYSELAEAMKLGEVHWATDTGLVAAKLVHEVDAEAIAIKWKKGRGRYRSILFARNDSPIESIADLRGKTVVFEDPSSFSSYFLPRFMIEREGERLHLLRSLHDERRAGCVNYLFGRTEKNIALWVDKGLVDAGALSSSDWHSARRMLPETRARMRQVQESEEFPRSFELVSTLLPTELKLALTELLMQMTIKTHKPVLKAYERTSRFEPLTDEHLAQLRTFFEMSKAW